LCSVPTCVLNFKNQTFVKNLCEDDLKYLTSSQFADWKNFVITRYLRNELDIENPLQRIAEAETRDELEDDLNDRVADEI
jgi:hypothetical protein